MNFIKRLEAIEKKVDYLTQIIENHIVKKPNNPQSKNSLQRVIENTLANVEAHPAFKNTKNSQMLREILEPMMDLGGSKE